MSSGLDWDNWHFDNWNSDADKILKSAQNFEIYTKLVAEPAQLEHGAWQGRLGFRLQGWSETKVVRRTDGQVNRRSAVVFRWLDSHSGEKEEKDRGKCNFRTNCKPSAISRTSLSEFPAQPTDQQPIGRNSQFLIALQLQHRDVLANFDECLHQGWHWYQHQWQKDSTHLSVYVVLWCIWGRKFKWLLTENSKLWHTPSDNQLSILLCFEVLRWNWAHINSWISVKHYSQSF